MIVKVQRSIATPHEYRQLLIYDEMKIRIVQFDLTETWDAYFKKNELKFFAEVRWPRLRTLPKLVRKLPNQGW